MNAMQRTQSKSGMTIVIILIVLSLGLSACQTGASASKSTLGNGSQNALELTRKQKSLFSSEERKWLVSRTTEGFAKIYDRFSKRGVTPREYRALTDILDKWPPEKRLLPKRYTDALVEGNADQQQYLELSLALSLSGRDLTCQGIARVFKQESVQTYLKDLVVLNLAYNRLGDCEAGIGFPKGSQSLRRLRLSGTELTARGLTSLTSHDSFAGLQVLVLNWVDLSVPTVRYLSVAPFRSSIRELHLLGCNIDGMHLSKLFDSGTAWTNLEILDLTGNPLDRSKQVLPDRTWPCDAPSLKELYLGKTRIGRRTFESLFRCQTELRILNAADTAFDEASANSLSESRTAHTLRELNLRNIDEATLVALAGYKFPNLRGLAVQGAEITEYGTKRLCRSSWVKQLQLLDLSHNPIGNKGVEVLADSCDFRMLKSLKLRNCRISDFDLLRRLGSALPKLDILSLSDNPFVVSEDSGCAFPSKKEEGDFQVRRFEFQIDTLSSECLRAVLALFDQQFLQHILLRGCSLSKADLPWLSAQGWDATIEGRVERPCHPERLDGREPEFYERSGDDL
jgi:Leucine-rich repeat (LRR) protein